ncbi:hypothetical protein MKW92_035496 [Papaver armeniacum]|nr:hypothetical protein MKW92_035496 [Papaver armeniacum]
MEHQRKEQRSDPMHIEEESEVGSPFRESGGDPEDRAVREEYGRIFSKFFRDIHFTKHQQEMTCMHMLNIFSGEDPYKYIEKHFPKKITFSEIDRMVEVGNLRPLNITVSVGQNALNRAFIDIRASLNLIYQNTIHQLRIPQWQSEVSIPGYGTSAGKVNELLERYSWRSPSGLSKPLNYFTSHM